MLQGFFFSSLLPDKFAPTPYSPLRESCRRLRRPKRDSQCTPLAVTALHPHMLIVILLILGPFCHTGEWCRVITSRTVLALFVVMVKSISVVAWPSSVSLSHSHLGFWRSPLDIRSNTNRHWHSIGRLSAPGWLALYILIGLSVPHNLLLS